MTGNQPDFRDLVGEDLTPEERDRLENVHELLIAAGPPPELPPALAEPSTEIDDEETSWLPRRRTGAVLALAAALALVAFLGGFLAGRNNGESFTSVKAVPMHGVGKAQAASATIDIGQLDGQGNWPLEVKVNHLPAPPKNGYYEMFLTRHGKIAATCGTFNVNGSTATVRLNAPYNLGRFDGWVVTLERPGANGHPVVLTT